MIINHIVPPIVSIIIIVIIIVTILLMEDQDEAYDDVPPWLTMMSLSGTRPRVDRQSFLKERPWWVRHCKETLLGG